MDTTERHKTVTSALLEQATTAATTAVERNSDLRGPIARRTARAALDAGGPPIRAAHTLKLAGDTSERAIAATFLAATTVVLHISTLGYIAVKGGPALRVAAAVSLGGHLTLNGLVRWFKHRTAVAARAELKDAG